MDVTYIHIPGHGWWYAVTVIDYYSRYLLACHLTFSYSVIQVVYALKLARDEAERIGGPLAKRPFLVTDNGPSFIARRFADFVREPYSHVRIQYRTPQQLGLLERFHQTLKTEEVYWRLYENPQHAHACLAEFHVRYNNVRPHWALVPEEGGDPLVPAEVYAGHSIDSDSALAGLGTRCKRKAGDVVGGRSMRQPSRRDFAGIVPASRGCSSPPPAPPASPKTSVIYRSKL